MMRFTMLLAIVSGALVTMALAYIGLLWLGFIVGAGTGAVLIRAANFLADEQALEKRELHATL